jgi:hypothetical protein
LAEDARAVRHGTCRGGLDPSAISSKRAPGDCPALSVCNRSSAFPSVAIPARRRMRALSVSRLGYQHRQRRQNLRGPRHTTAARPSHRTHLGRSLASKRACHCSERKDLLRC